MRGSGSRHRAAETGGELYTLEDYVAPMIASGQLVSLLETWIPPPSDGFFLYYPSRRQNPASLQALIYFLRANLKAGGSSAQNADATRGKANETITMK